LNNYYYFDCFTKSYETSEVDHFANTLIIAYNTSVVYWIPPAKFVVGCAAEYRFWPYDTQICDIIIGSWAHDGSEIDLTVNSDHTEVRKQQSVWNL